MKIISELAGAFIDSSMSPADYLFSYRNNLGDVVDFFESSLQIRTSSPPLVIPYSDLYDVSINENVKIGEHQWIDLSYSTGTSKILVDGMEGKFLDIFPLYRFLRRRMISSSAASLSRNIDGRNMRE